MTNQVAIELKKYPVTMGLIILSCLVSLMTWFGSVESTLIWFVYDRDAILHGQVWRLITPIFLHFPAIGIIFAHLAFNMIWLYQFGYLIERCDSSKWLLIIVVISGIVSNAAQAFVSPYVLFGGMSGVVYALLGYLFLLKKLDPYYLGRVPDNIIYFLIGFMVIATLGVFGAIANTAHIVGFIVGLLFAAVRHFARADSR
ncbi:MAG: rhomboid family intramembrane serine protease [Gammaproteobacteria bacterium]|nr:MAG: rhomboid family intramembrane serine protease [Gammaproteobacteria bacterium]